MLTVIIIAAAVAALIVFFFLCYKKAPPTQAIVVTGLGLSRPKVVCGRGVFVLPIVQRADRLNMRLLKIDVKTPETGVKTKEGVSLWLDSVVTVQVYSENSTVADEEVRNAGYDDVKKYINSRQQAAISIFLGMDEAHINEKINDVLQGNLREIVSEMTVDQILTNRKQMAISVVENARPDLAKMGLEVVTFNVQDVKDAIDAQRQLFNEREVAAAMLCETTTAFARAIAAKAAELPIEVFKLMPRGASRKVAGVVRNYMNVDAATENHVMQLEETYHFKGQTYTEVDLNGIADLNSMNESEAENRLARAGFMVTETSFNYLFACILASMATGLPEEFFTGLPLREVLKLKNAVNDSGFFE